MLSDYEVTKSQREKRRANRGRAKTSATNRRHKVHQPGRTASNKEHTEVVRVPVPAELSFDNEGYQSYNYRGVRRRNSTATYAVKARVFPAAQAANDKSDTRHKFLAVTTKRRGSIRLQHAPADGGGWGSIDDYEAAADGFEVAVPRAGSVSQHKRSQEQSAPPRVGAGTVVWSTRSNKQSNKQARGLVWAVAEPAHAHGPTCHQRCWPRSATWLLPSSYSGGYTCRYKVIFCSECTRTHAQDAQCPSCEDAECSASELLFAPPATASTPPATLVPCYHDNHGAEHHSNERGRGKHPVHRQLKPEIALLAVDCDSAAEPAQTQRTIAGCSTLSPPNPDLRAGPHKRQSGHGHGRRHGPPRHRDSDSHLPPGGMLLRKEPQTNPQGPVGTGTPRTQPGVRWVQPSSIAPTTMVRAATAQPANAARLQLRARVNMLDGHTFVLEGLARDAPLLHVLQACAASLRNSGGGSGSGSGAETTADATTATTQDAALASALQLELYVQGDESALRHWPPASAPPPPPPPPGQQQPHEQQQQSEAVVMFLLPSESASPTALALTVVAASGRESASGGPQHVGGSALLTRMKAICKLVPPAPADGAPVECTPGVCAALVAELLQLCLREHRGRHRARVHMFESHARLVTAVAATAAVAVRRLPRCRGQAAGAVRTPQPPAAMLANTSTLAQWTSWASAGQFGRVLCWLVQTNGGSHRHTQQVIDAVFNFWCQARERNVQLPGGMLPQLVTELVECGALSNREALRAWWYDCPTWPDPADKITRLASADEAGRVRQAVDRVLPREELEGDDDETPGNCDVFSMFDDNGMYDY
jgi:hypothetical protein